ncbi:MAG: dihydrodipicolinate synthase family protein [Betaproteobacteria bacterium]|nr:dihydrodipicolinate synthase family protein [Betaproteobacteria bacterium]
MAQDRIRGVLSPVVTPFNEDLSPDAERFIRHCKWLVSQRVGLAVFGTNSEANSLSANERMALLEALVNAGVDPKRMMPGTGCCALSDSVRLTEHAVKLGVAGALMLPPFYYKGVSDEGLYRNFSEVIQRVGDSRLRIYLYHIPPVSQVPITLNLIERLLKAYPGTIAGLKDSSGDWNNTKAVLDRFGKSGFDVFAGSESFLLQNMRNGGAGCITAGANVNPAQITSLYDAWQGAGADSMQKAIDDVRNVLQSVPMIPALKRTISHYSGDKEWNRLRPPLTELTAQQEQQLLQGLEKLDFGMPGVREAALA